MHCIDGRRVTPMKHCVLEETDDLFIVQTDDDVYTLPKNNYFVLKLNHFDGNRIFYDFEKNGAHVEETYNDGIFNCYYGKHTIQIADGVTVAGIILDKNYDAFVSLFKKWYEIKAENDIISGLLSQYSDRINFDKKTGIYIIDDIFGVDTHGITMCRTKGNNWKNICLVVQSSKQSTEFIMPLGKTVVVNQITQIIISKMMFLLFPKPDKVFFNQLPLKARTHVKYLIERGFDTFEDTAMDGERHGRE